MNKYLQAMRIAASWSPFHLSPSGLFGSGPGASGMSQEDAADIIAGRNILIVEDEALLAFDLDLAISDFGGEVLGPALSLEEAEQLVKANDAIDAAILDVDLHGKDVFPVAHILQQRGTPFLFHTGHASKNELLSLFPGSIICRKPTSVAQLMSNVATLIRDRQPR